MLMEHCRLNGYLHNRCFTNVAYSNLSYALADFEASLRKALNKMDIRETGRKEEDNKGSTYRRLREVSTYTSTLR